MTIQLVAENFIPELPDKFKCPICGEKICIDDITGCVEDDNGQWCADEIAINCVTEPDIDSDEWEDWQNSHWSMPYVDWLPLEKEIENWLMDNYRFDLYGRTAEEELQALVDWNAGRARHV